MVDAVGEPDAECEEEIVVILASADSCADPALEEDLAITQRGGRRAICVWPEGAAADAKPPDAMNKYPYSIIRCDPEQFRVVASGEDQHCFEAPNGEPLPKPQTERNLCVDEKAKAS